MLQEYAEGHLVFHNRIGILNNLEKATCLPSLFIRLISIYVPYSIQTI